MSTDFVDRWKEVQQQVHETTKMKGFWAYSPQIPVKTILAEKICLMHSELSEGLEAIRNDPEGLGNLSEELADTVIRIMDVNQKYNLRVEEELLRKIEINKTRQFRHGKEL